MEIYNDFLEITEPIIRKYFKNDDWRSVWSRKVELWKALKNEEITTFVRSMRFGLKLSQTIADKIRITLLNTNGVKIPDDFL